MSTIDRRTVLLASGVAAVAGLAASRLSPAHADPVAPDIGGPSPSVPGLTTVRASDFGFDKSDSTVHLQAALDSDADVVIIDKQTTDWVSGPLFLRRSDVTVIVEQRTVLRGLPGGFPKTSDALFTIATTEDVAVSNVTISGYGAVFSMNKPEYASGEHRHALSLKSVSNVLVEGLVLRDSGGDGLYIGASLPEIACRNLIVRDVTCHNNRRNGMSVTSVDGLVIEGCSIRNTAGTAPDAGIDFEPNRPNYLMRRILVRDTSIVDNMIYGVAIALDKLDATSAPVDLTFERVVVSGNSSHTPTFTFKGPADADPGGTVTLRQCLVNKEAASGAATTSTGYGGKAAAHVTGSAMGVFGVFAKPTDGTQIILEDTVLWDRNNPYQMFPPIAVSPMTLTFTGSSSKPVVTSTYGGIEFRDSALVTDCEDLFLSAVHESSDSPGLAGLTGRLVVVNRNSATANLGARPNDNPITIDHDRSRSIPSVSLSVDRREASLGDTVTFTVTRQAGRLDYPVAVRYLLGGTVDGYAGVKEPAVLGLDTAGLSGVVVIPARQRSATITVPSRVVEGRTNQCYLTVALQPGYGYELPSAMSNRIIEVALR